jgi:Rad3-related DNA helicase
MSINLKNKIVILDEAHNIEDSCREATSFIMSQIQIDAVRKELERSLKYMLSDEVGGSMAYFLTVVRGPAKTAPLLLVFEMFGLFFFFAQV